MEFSERYHLIKNSYDPLKSLNSIPGTGIHIHYLPFVSMKDNDSNDNRMLMSFRDHIPSTQEDKLIKENYSFSYPVFTPPGHAQNKGVIILLHGLNERKWDKYLTWAHYLTEKTGKSVILFPISFHQNRGPVDWADPRTMREKAEIRKSRLHNKNGLSTLFNYALSERLSESPERFFLSGLQTANDLVNLLKDIREGRHPLFAKETNPDIFAYSIGGLLAQVLYISNPHELFTHSKLFLFCAGSLFSEMNGISKVILDTNAHQRIQYYYQNEFEEKIKTSGLFADFFNQQKIGMAFRSMIAPERFRKLREKVFTHSKDKIYAISLLKDQVIPPDKISQTLMGSKTRLPENMEVFDFNYAYSHEMPFPVKNTELSSLLNQAFEKIFRKAAVFLS